MRRIQAQPIGQKKYLNEDGLLAASLAGLKKPAMEAEINRAAPRGITHEDKAVYAKYLASYRELLKKLEKLDKSKPRQLKSKYFCELEKPGEFLKFIKDYLSILKEIPGRQEKITDAHYELAIATLKKAAKTGRFQSCEAELRQLKVVYNQPGWVFEPAGNSKVHLRSPEPDHLTVRVMRTIAANTSTKFMDGLDDSGEGLGWDPSPEDLLVGCPLISVVVGLTEGPGKKEIKVIQFDSVIPVIDAVQSLISYLEEATKNYYAEIYSKSEEWLLKMLEVAEEIENHSENYRYDSDSTVAYAIERLAEGQAGTADADKSAILGVLPPKEFLYEFENAIKQVNAGWLGLAG